MVLSSLILLLLYLPPARLGTGGDELRVDLWAARGTLDGPPGAPSSWKGLACGTTGTQVSNELTFWVREDMRYQGYPKLTYG